MAVNSRTYDLAGQVKTQTDAKGKLTTMVYDSRGRRTSLTDRIAATTTWTFDPAGNELSMTDAEGQTTAYTYDNAGRHCRRQAVLRMRGDIVCHFYENLLPVKRESLDQKVNAAGIPIFYPSIGSDR